MSLLVPGTLAGGVKKHDIGAITSLIVGFFPRCISVLYLGRFARRVNERKFDFAIALVEFPGLAGDAGTGLAGGVKEVMRHAVAALVVLLGAAGDRRPLWSRRRG